MEVELLHFSPLRLAVMAGRKCTDTEGDDMGPKDMTLLRQEARGERTSFFEHVYYTFDIPMLSRACLQELARHRIASPSVQSPRFTLTKLIKAVQSPEEIRAMLTPSGDPDIDELNFFTLCQLRNLIIRKGLKNDVAKYAIPEAFKTTMMWTINARSMRNFLRLRTSKRAHWEIRELANAVFAALPESHRVLYEDIFSH